MNDHEADNAASSDHLALGTITHISGSGVIHVEIDHLEEVPELGQRVTIVAGWELGSNRGGQHTP